ncbi:hypothetical protein D3C73_1212480 [compost metagenome]
MPKSSIDSDTPRARTWRRDTSVSAMLPISAFSVTSSSSRWGSTPALCNAREISSLNSSRARVRGEQLMAIFRFAQPWCDSSPRSSQALRSTQLSSSVIRPLASAMPMKRSGARNPWTGCCQRIKASSLLTWPVFRS